MPPIRWFPLFAPLLGCTSHDPAQEAEGPKANATAVATARIPAGSFTMGSPEDEVGRYPDEVPHPVTIGRDFLVGTTVITREQFIGLLGYENTVFEGDDLPITSVTWHEAAAFTVALSQAAGLAPCYECEGQGPSVSCHATVKPSACPGWRLPTEAEWEYAARGGLEGQAYPNGGGLHQKDALSCWGPVELDDGKMLGEQAWHCGTGGGIKPVAMLAPNGYGLYDMAGNIWEWVHDWYGPYPAGATDPVGPETGSERIVRGGSSKLYYPLHLRVAFRLAIEPTTRAPMIGFRVVRNAP